MADLRQFRQFVAVAEELSFRRAAERLHMAQPPLTTAIRRLEEEVGASLLERDNRIHRLTPAGRAFLDEARRTLAQAERTLAAARSAASGRRTLRLAFVDSTINILLPRIPRRSANSMARWTSSSRKTPPQGNWRRCAKTASMPA